MDGWMDGWMDWLVGWLVGWLIDLLIEIHGQLRRPGRGARADSAVAMFSIPRSSQASDLSLSLSRERERIPAALSVGFCPLGVAHYRSGCRRRRLCGGDDNLIDN